MLPTLLFSWLNVMNRWEGAIHHSRGRQRGRLAAASSASPARSSRRYASVLSIFVKPERSTLVFPGAMGGPLRRSNFNKMSAWPYAVRSVGAEGLHVHDLRHTGNTVAASGGAGIKDLMARMGHDSERAAMIYSARGPRRGPDDHERDRSARPRRAARRR